MSDAREDLFSVVRRPLFDRIFGPRRPRIRVLADALKCVRGHESCLGPEVPANQGGCRMGSWSDVG